MVLFIYSISSPFIPTSLNYWCFNFIAQFIFNLFIFLFLKFLNCSLFILRSDKKISQNFIIFRDRNDLFLIWFKIFEIFFHIKGYFQIFTFLFLFLILLLNFAIFLFINFLIFNFFATKFSSSFFKLFFSHLNSFNIFYR